VQASRNRERVRTAARAANHRKVFESEVVGERRDIINAADNVSSRVPIGSSIAGAVIRDDPGSDLGVLALVEVPT
jgi:hypothetical protein